MSLTAKMFELVGQMQAVDNQVILEAAKKTCLQYEIADLEEKAKTHKKLGNKARKARDWAFHLTFIKGEDRLATARDAAEWTAYHRNQAEAALVEANDCLAVIGAM